MKNKELKPCLVCGTPCELRKFYITCQVCDGQGQIDDTLGYSDRQIVCYNCHGEEYEPVNLRYCSDICFNSVSED